MPLRPTRVRAAVAGAARCARRQQQQQQQRGYSGGPVKSGDGRSTAHDGASGIGRFKWPSLPAGDRVATWTDDAASKYLAGYTPLVHALFDSSGRAGNIAQRTPLLRRLTTDLHYLEQAGAAGPMAYTVYVEVMCRGGVVGRVVRSIPQRLRARGHVPSRRVYNALLQGLAAHGRIHEMWAVRCDMRADGVTPDVFTYNALMTCFVHRRQWHEVLRVAGVMKREGIAPNDLTYDRMIASCPGLSPARRILVDMKAAGVNLKASHFVSMLTACRRSPVPADRVPHAERVMRAVRLLKIGPTGQHYDALMAAHKEAGDFEGVERVLYDRVKDGVEPTALTYSLYLAACAARVHTAGAAAVVNAEKCFEHAVTHGMHGAARVYIEMLRVYAAAKDLPKAKALTAALHGSLQHIEASAAYQLLLLRLHRDVGRIADAEEIEAVLTRRWQGVGLTPRQIAHRLAHAPLHHLREIKRVP